MDGNDVKTCTQTRPLFGQAAHVANLSLLFKSTKYGWEGQLAGAAEHQGFKPILSGKGTVGRRGGYQRHQPPPHGMRLAGGRGSRS